MTRDQACIALAERMGWQRVLPNSHVGAGWLEGNCYGNPFRSTVPDPFTNSADCDALIDFMVGKKWNYILLSDEHGSEVEFAERKRTEFGTSRIIHDWPSRHEAITLCACEALGIECDDV